MDVTDNPQALIEVRRVADIVRKDLERKSWGNWTWRKRTNELLFTKNRRIVYYLDLDRAQTCAGLLDWIFQVYPKRWMTPQDVVDLLDAFRSILHPQANMCSFGKDVAAAKATAIQDAAERYPPAVHRPSGVSS